MQIVSGSSDMYKTVQMWEASTGAKLNVLRGHIVATLPAKSQQNHVYSAAISRNSILMEHMYSVVLVAISRDDYDWKPAVAGAGNSEHHAIEQDRDL